MNLRTGDVGVRLADEYTPMLDFGHCWWPMRHYRRSSEALLLYIRFVQHIFSGMPQVLVEGEEATRSRRLALSSESLAVNLRHISGCVATVSSYWLPPVPASSARRTGKEGRIGFSTCRHVKKGA